MSAEVRGGRSAARGAALAAILASAAFAPLFYGSISGWPLWALTAATGIVAILASVVHAGRVAAVHSEASLGPSGTGTAMFRASAAFAGAFAVLVFIQILPLGDGIGRLRFGPLADLGVPESAMPGTISVCPGATRVSWVLLLAACVPAAAAWVVLRKKEHLFAVSGTLAAVGGLVGFYGLLNFVSSGALSLHGGPGQAGARAAGTFVNPNHFSAFMGMLIPVCLSVTALKSRAWRKPGDEGFARSLASFSQDVSRRWWKILACLSFVAMALAAVFSESRMGIASAAGGIGVFVLLGFVVRRRSRGAGTLGATAAVLVLACLAVAAWIGLEPVMNRFGTLEPSMAQRLGIWSDALSVVRDFPVLGTGLGTFPHVFPAYQSADLQGGYSFPHSEYAHLLVETGFAGFALALAAAGFWAAGFMRRFVSAEVRSDRLITAAGAFAGAFTMVLNCGTELSLRIPANYFVFSLLVGTSAVALYGGSIRVRKDREGPAAGVSSPGAGVAMLAAPSGQAPPAGSGGGIPNLEDDAD